MKKNIHAICLLLLLFSSQAFGTSYYDTFERKLESQFAPGVDFKEASLTEVLHFLREASKEIDKQVPAFEHNFISHVSTELKEGVSPRKVTLKMQSATFIEVIRHVCIAMDIEYYISGRVVVFTNKGDLPSLLRIYNVLPTTFGGLNLSSDDKTRSKQIIEFFTRLGIKFPEGATAKYIPEIGKLIIGNTVHNITMFERVFASINLLPNQVKTSVQIIEVIDNKVFSAATNDQFFVQNEEELISSGKIEVVCELETVSFSATPGAAKITMQQKKTSKSGAEISEPFSVYFEITPNVSSEGELSFLDIKGRAAFHDSDDASRTCHYEIKSNLCLFNWDKDTAMLVWLNAGRGKGRKKSLVKRYFKVTASLVEPSGRKIAGFGILPDIPLK